LRFSPNLTDFRADYITVLEGRLPVPVFYFWRKL